MNERDILPWITKYSRRGWYLFPVCPREKKPRIKDPLNAAANDIETLFAWFQKWPDSNWGLSLAKSGLVAVDVDAAGLALWAGYVANHGEPETLKARSGSGVGRHFVFTAAEGVAYRAHFEDNTAKAKIKGIDVKWHGYICVQPSLHASGNTYTWLNELAPADMPPWLCTLCVKPATVKRGAVPKVSVNNKYFAELVSRIKAKHLTYSQWLKCGMALHAEFNGDEYGYSLWDEISRGPSYKPGDDEVIESKWATFH